VSLRPTALAAAVAFVTLTRVPVPDALYIRRGNNERPWGHPGMRHKKPKGKRKGGKR
jgi:hypothetical protein